MKYSNDFKAYLLGKHKSIATLAKFYDCSYHALYNELQGLGSRNEHVKTVLNKEWAEYKGYRMLPFMEEYIKG